MSSTSRNPLLRRQQRLHPQQALNQQVVLRQVTSQQLSHPPALSKGHQVFRAWALDLSLTPRLEFSVAHKYHKTLKTRPWVP